MPTAIRKRGRDRYLELIYEFPLRPIRTDEELDNASKMLDELMDRDTLSGDEEDYRIVLERLIADYENEFHEIPPVPDRELLRHLIDAKGVKQIDVANATGICYSTISFVLAGTRTLTREQIGKLSRYFGVSIDTFSFD